MDHAVSLVQAYLQLNGYFTSAEYPIIAGAGRNGFRTITDIDILAFRFPSGLPILPVRKTPQGLDITDVDDGLGIAPDKVDMIIGEVKEGRVGINSGVRDPAVLRAVLFVALLRARVRFPAAFFGDVRLYKYLRVPFFDGDFFAAALRLVVNLAIFGPHS